MPIEFKCNHCQSVLRTPDDTAGKLARCPSCGKLESIPEVMPVRPAQTPIAQAKPIHYGTPPSRGNQGSPYASPQFSGQPMDWTATRESARYRLMPPAIVLIVFNGVGMLFTLMAIFGGILSIAENGGNGEDVGLLIVCCSMELLYLIGILGCIGMLRMRRFAFAVIGVVCSIVVGIPCCMIPSGLGIWALVVVLDPNVKRFFR